MGQSTAIIIGAVIVAAAIMVTNHYQLFISEHTGLGAAMRLDRWSGTIDICVTDVSTFNGKDLRGSKLTCEAK